MLPLFVAGTSLTILMWTVYQTQVPIRGVVFDYDVIEQSKNSFIGLHKVMFNSSSNLPITCIHVVARGVDMKDVLVRTSLPGPVEQEVVLSNVFGMCTPFRPGQNEMYMWIRLVCAFVAFTFVGLEFLSCEHERERKTPLLPLRKSDSNFVLHAPSNNDNDGVEKEV
jgi:hypothetical protein